MRSALRTFQQAADHLHGTLRIVYNNAFDHKIIMSSIQAFRSDHPNVNFTFQQKSMSNMLETLWHNEADIGLLTSTGEYHLNNAIDSQKLQDLSIFPLMEDTLLAAISKQSPLSKQKSISINTILKNPLILFMNDTLYDAERNWLVQLLQQYEKPNFVMTSNTLELYINAIVTNTGIGFLTKASTRFPPKTQLETINIFR